MNVDSIEQVTVIGMGTMGPDIALAFARGSYDVTAFARRQETLDSAKKRIESNCIALVKNGFMRAEEVESFLSRVEFTLLRCAHKNKGKVSHYHAN